MDDIVAQVRELLAQVDKAPGCALPPGATAADLAAFESRTGVALPAELKSWFSLCDGPLVGAEGLFGLRPGEHTVGRALGIEEVLDSWPEWKALKWLPVAGDGCGNYYCVDLVETGRNGHPLFFVDVIHDSHRPAYAVASDIWHFVWFYLREDLRRDDDDEHYWPFAKDRVLEEDMELAHVKGSPLPWDVADQP